MVEAVRQLLTKDLQLYVLSVTRCPSMENRNQTVSGTSAILGAAVPQSYSFNGYTTFLNTYTGFWTIK
jgi:hypothetical protein